MQFSWLAFFKRNHFWSIWSISCSCFLCIIKQFKISEGFYNDSHDFNVRLTSVELDFSSNSPGSVGSEFKISLWIPDRQRWLLRPRYEQAHRKVGKPLSHALQTSVVETFLNCEINLRPSRSQWDLRCLQAPEKTKQSVDRCGDGLFSVQRHFWLRLQGPQWSTGEGRNCVQKENTHLQKEEWRISSWEETASIPNTSTCWKIDRRDTEPRLAPNGCFFGLWMAVGTAIAADGTSAGLCVWMLASTFG